MSQIYPWLQATMLLEGLNHQPPSMMSSFYPRIGEKHRLAASWPPGAWCLIASTTSSWQKSQFHNCGPGLRRKPLFSWFPILETTHIARSMKIYWGHSVDNESRDLGPPTTWDGIPDFRLYSAFTHNDMICISLYVYMMF